MATLLRLIIQFSWGSNMKIILVSFMKLEKINGNACHPERSEGSLREDAILNRDPYIEILRFAQDDMDRDIFQREFALPE